MPKLAQMKKNIADFCRKIFINKRKTKEEKPRKRKYIIRKSKDGETIHLKKNMFIYNSHAWP